MANYHRLTPEQRAWAEEQLNRKARLSSRRQGIAVDYKPDMSGVGVYLQVLKPSVKAILGDPQYEEVWRAFPKEIASRHRPMTRGDIDESYLEEYIDIEGDMEESVGYG